MSQTIGVAGLGLLGRGIVTCFLSRGFRVIGHSRTAKTRDEARAYIRQGIEDLVARGGFNRSLLGEWESRYTEADDLARFKDCDFVIESVLEDPQIKQATFDQIEAVIRPEVVLASNTSALPISQLQQGRRHPNRMIGSHWAEPCHLTKFLEVIRGQATDEPTVQTTLNLMQQAGKEPTLVNRDIDGFIVNRIGYAMYREALHLVDQGIADFENIDRALRNALGIWAEVTGPFRWMDLTGLPSYVAVMKRLFPKLSNATTVPKFLQDLVDSGAGGISNGRGFYQYTPEEIHKWEQKIIDHVWAMRDFAEKHR